MKSDYEILGIQEDASEKEIKRAYSGLLRKYPPEENPEMFQKIHDAYERIRKGEPEDAPQFELPEDQEAQMCAVKLRQYEEYGDYKIFCETAEKVARKFPEEVQFLYTLAKAQILAGKTGKAVKNCEKLVELEPENKWYWSLYARALMERGFNKKAYPAFEKAYKLGARDPEFMMFYVEACEDSHKSKKAAEIANESLQTQNIKNVESFEKALLFFGRWVLAAEFTDGERRNRLIAALRDLLKRGRAYIDKTPEKVMMTITMVLMLVRDGEDEAALYDEFIRMVKPELHSAESMEVLENFEGAFIEDRIKSDDRFTDTVKAGTEIFFGDFEEGGDIFSKLDWQLCMIQEREEVLPQLTLLKEEYPEYYDKIADFAHTLEKGTGLQNIKNSLMKQYDPMTDVFDDGRFYALYPEEREKLRGRIIYQSEDAVPYVRSGKKIGRNDPCPCGSGKKYKNCCMNKMRA